jgi:GNAT superfamily N-acetyltransferase
MDYEIIVGENRISDLQRTLGLNTWPEFMQHDSVVNKYWPDLYTDFLKFQCALFDKQEIVGISNTVHLNWQRSFSELPDNGLDWAIDKASKDFKLGLKPNLLIGVQILINPKYQSQGISYKMLTIMKDIAKSNGIDNIALPVRPTLKSDYPLIPIDKYVNWQNKDKLPFDPWIRVHTKAGGKIVGICDKSMSISGTISDWEKWTGLLFPDSGDYIVDKALIPISVDKKKDIGTYIEPNVWIIHELK